MLSRIDWIKEIYPDFVESEWMHEAVISQADIKLFFLYETDRFEYEDYINPRDIIGIFYAFAYNWFSDISWTELLNSLKRFDWIRDNFSSYQEVEHHIHNNKETKLVEKYGDQLITIRGQHRLCLAKFFRIEKVKVHIIEFKINEKKLQCFRTLQRHRDLFKKL